jgi:hypothetical protein
MSPERYALLLLGNPHDDHRDQDRNSERERANRQALSDIHRLLDSYSAWRQDGTRNPSTDPWRHCDASDEQSGQDQER